MHTETIETESHRRIIAAERLSVERDDWHETERPEREEAIDAYLDAHPEIVVGAAVGVM